MGRGARRVALALALTCAPAYAQRSRPKPPTTVGVTTAGRDIEAAEQLYAKLDYQGANDVAERIVKSTGLTHDQLVRAYRILAVSYAVLGKEGQARDAFLRLLTYDADFAIDANASPKVNAAFVEARGSFRSLPTKPGIEVSARVSDRGGVLRVTTRDPSRIVQRVTVGYRWTSAGEYTVTQVLAEASAVVEVAAPPRGRTRLDFYVQALDDHGSAVLEAGNALVPRSAFADSGTEGAPAERHAEASFLGSPVFWIAAGVLAAGGGAAAYFALRSPDPANSAALSPVMLCGSARCD